VAQGRVVLIGASGDQGRTIARVLSDAEPELPLVLCGRDPARVRERVPAAGRERAEVRALDVADPAALAQAIGDARLVVNATGPAYRNAEPVMRACIDAGVDCLDLQDDPEAVRAALALDEEARDAGVAIHAGCGTAPGLSSMLAVEAVRSLDEVESLDCAWVVGDEGPREPGRATLLHLLHVAGGECVRWVDGEPVAVTPFEAAASFPIAGMGDATAYEVAHPEPLTYGRAWPGLRLARCFGALDPAPANGMWRGLAQAVHGGRLPLDAAVAFLQDVSNDGTGAPGPWRHALAGTRGLASPRAVAGFMWQGLRKRHPDYRGGIAVRAVGTREGRRVSVVRRTARWGPGTPWTSFEELNGRLVAAFVVLALDGARERRGTLFPETWAEPAELYATVERHGAPAGSLVDAEVVEPAPAAA
jgi:hypothetical protein